MLLALQLIAWSVAVAWLTRIFATLRGIPTIPDLTLPHYDVVPDGMPSITVIVPARNEAQNIRACLESLLAQDYAHLRVIAVDDRSTDETGAVMDALTSPRLSVLHITELPPQWLGKTHAMATAANHAIAQHQAEFLLFTDGDVIFAPSAIRRSLANAVATTADHFVLAPTTTIRRWDEAALLGFFQVFGVWAARPWKVADPKALRDAVGIGAFNMVRTAAYQRIGGFEALRMEVVEDLALARRIKRNGLRQRIAFGRNLVSVHWATGVNGLIGVMTKNIFAAFRFNIPLLVLCCLWLVGFCIAPYAALWYWPVAIPAAITILAISAGYLRLGPFAGLSPWNALLAPLAAATLIYAIVRSMVTTLRQGGVLWRGTFYPLSELRKHASPIFPVR